MVDLNRVVMGTLAVVALLLIAFPKTTFAETTATRQDSGALEIRTLLFEGEEQRYLLYLPGSYDPSTPAALVVVFRGSNTPAEAMLRVGFNDQADEAGFLVVYPDLEVAGTLPVWTRFTAQLLDILGSELSVDPRRIYVAGFPGGAAVTHRIACELTNRVAAVAAVDAAPLPVGDGTLDVRGNTFPCEPARPIAVLHFHGTDSGQSPYANARALIPFWATANGCSLQPEETVMEVAGERVIQEAYRSCAQGVEVTLYSVEGGVHAWPGAPRHKRDLPLGANEEAPASMAIAATPIIWEFFEAHPMSD